MYMYKDPNHRNAADSYGHQVTIWYITSSQWCANIMMCL